MNPNSNTDLLITAYVTAIPNEGISSGALYAVVMASVPVSLGLHQRMLAALQDPQACRGRPKVSVSNHYVTLTEAGRKLRDDLLQIVADIATGKASA